MNAVAETLTPFSADYAGARARFRDTAARAGWPCEAYPIGVAGPSGEELTIDVAASPAAASPRVLVVSSGTHGIEGGLGSAIQSAMLERWSRPPGLPSGIRVVMLHALNPYGFAWGRRVDSDNIDPNRNFLTDGEAYRGAPAQYGKLDSLLNPRSPPSRIDLFQVRAAAAILRHGMPALKAAVVAGQYDYPAGLFFGGQGPSRTLTVLREHMKAWIGDPEFVFHLDIHSGLGDWGRFKLFTDCRLDDRSKAWIDASFGAGMHFGNDPRGPAYETRGSLGLWCAARKLAPDYVLAFAECGTYGNLRVLAGLRAENQAHFWGRRDDPACVRARENLREIFYPSAFDWRRTALAHGIELVERAVARVRAGLVAAKPGAAAATR